MSYEFNLYWSKIDHEEAPYQKYDFSCNFKVRIDSKVPTPGPGVLKYGESNGDGLDPELECRKSKFSDRGTLNSADSHYSFEKRCQMALKPLGNFTYIPEQTTYEHSNIVASNCKCGISYT